MAPDVITPAQLLLPRIRRVFSQAVKPIVRFSFSLTACSAYGQTLSIHEIILNRRDNPDLLDERGRTVAVLNGKLAL